MSGVYCFAVPKQTSQFNTRIVSLCVTGLCGTQCARCVAPRAGILLLPTEPDDFETLLTLSARRAGFAVTLDHEALVAALASGGCLVRFRAGVLLSCGVMLAGRNASLVSPRCCVLAIICVTCELFPHAESSSSGSSRHRRSRGTVRDGCGTRNTRCSGLTSLHVLGRRAALATQAIWTCFLLDSPPPLTPVERSFSLCAAAQRDGASTRKIGHTRCADWRICRRVVRV